MFDFFQSANPVGLPNPQLAQSQPSTSIASGPPLPQHLHPYAQATLPLGYAGMIGYPSLPPSYAYIQPAAFQQPYMNNMFHQAAAAVPNSSVKYPLPQYKTLASLPQPASLLSSYVGGFGTANNMPGNFPVNQSTASPTTTLGFDGSVPPHYKDGNQFISLQQQVTILHLTFASKMGKSCENNFPFASDRMRTQQCGCMELVHEACPHLQLVPCMAIKGRVIKPVFGRAS